MNTVLFSAFCCCLHIHCRFLSFNVGKECEFICYHRLYRNIFVRQEIVLPFGVAFFDLVCVCVCLYLFSSSSRIHLISSYFHRHSKISYARSINSRMFCKLFAQAINVSHRIVSHSVWCCARTQTMPNEFHHNENYNTF